jgi:DDE superfamily endonuclease
VLILSNKKRKILYISKLYTGAKHDFSMLKTEFPVSLPWFNNYILWLDSGFQGFNELYETSVLHLSLRRRRAKKGQKSDLSTEQLLYNRTVGKERIYVEHSIGGMKRYRILQHRIRLKTDSTIDRIINVSAGLWNFNIST